MSSALAIAAVTAALKDLLNDGLLNHDLSQVGSFTVSAMPPDRIGTGQNEPNQLNWFMYHLAPNPGWRNAGLPTRDAGGNRVANAPLALDLHYLLTAYGSEDLNAEILLGYAMQLLHDNPVLTRAQLRSVLGGIQLVDGSILPGPFGSLSALDLAEQVELIKISPLYPSPDELSKMWTAMQARYRPSMAYSVSVVLIQSDRPARAAPPVLQRGKDDRGFALLPAWPELARVVSAASPLLPALRLGDSFILSGSGFESVLNLQIQMRLPNTGLENNFPPDLAISPQKITSKLPAVADDANAQHAFAIGAWQLSLQAQLPSGENWISNSVPLMIAPRITIMNPNQAAGDFSLQIECSPRILPNQESNVFLIFGDRMQKPAAITPPGDPLQPSSLQFDLEGIIAGDYLVRLRVDGIDSLPVLTSGTPPLLSFDPQQKVSVA